MTKSKSEVTIIESGKVFEVLKALWSRNINPFLDFCFCLLCLQGLIIASGSMQPRVPPPCS